MNTPMQTVIAFDFGTSRMGVASGQSLTGTASALAPLPARDGIPNWDTIQSLLDQWQPDCLVVGIPLNMDGTISEMARRARKFANRLHERFKYPVYLMDERLTTSEAKSIHLAKGGSRDYKNHSVDGIAAQLILESWFETEHKLPSHTPLETFYDIEQP